MRRVAFAFLLGVVFANPYQLGVDYGKRIMDRYGGSKVKSELMDPSMGKGEYRDLQGNVVNMDPPFCRSGNNSALLQSSREVLRVTVDGQNIYIRWSSSGSSLDRSFSYSGRYHCAGAVCSSLNPYRCVEFYIDSSGNLRTRSVNEAYSCADVTVNPQPPTLIGSKLIQDLVDSYGARGIEVFYTEEEVGDTTVSYYASEVNAQCGELREGISAGKYSGNPYSLAQEGNRYYQSCDPLDPSCRAIRAVYSPSNKSYRTCTVERKFGAGDRICSPDQEVYPLGYSDTSRICFAGDRWKDYSSSFWLKCSPDGRSYVLYGWGYWEGAPCKGGRLYPPSPQIRWRFSPAQSFGWEEIGRLSVNRRRGGEDVIEPDLVSDYDKECMPSDPTPYTVKVRGISYSSYAYLYVTVDNAPGCRSFTFRIDFTPQESIADGCKDMSKEGCKLVNEWWYDAYGRRTQVVKNGHRLVSYGECQEDVFDNSSKTYTSSYQTYQSQPQNCAGIQKTCKWIGGERVCRSWWKIVREYECSSNSSQYTYNLSKSRQVASTAYANLSSTGSVDWGYLSERKRAWTPGEECVKTCLVDVNGEPEVRECIDSRCPSYGATVLQNCECVEDSMSGAGYAIGAMGVLNEAFKNRECE